MAWSSWDTGRCKRDLGLGLQVPGELTAPARLGQGGVRSVSILVAMEHEALPLIKGLKIGQSLSDGMVRVTHRHCIRSPRLLTHTHRLCCA